MTANPGTIRTDKGGRPLVDARTGRPKTAGATKPKTGDDK